ncbi:trypsin-like serine peptidase [Actinocorallia longicatena]|uniref:Peptidase n=1 Tax=Actinocorallia longicatena TaxID=111803 RepID=A0ABP6PYU0_9ACTN
MTRVATALLGLAPVVPFVTFTITDAVPARVVTREFRVTSTRQVLRYWTLDRMDKAVTRPVRLHRRRSPLVAGLFPQERSAPSTHSSGELWPSRGAVRKTVGKVFFTMNGKDFLCSAATVRSASRDLVVTAGHCAKNGRGAWAENWIFVPGYRDGGGADGGYTARRMFVADQWSKSGDDDYDVAMVAVAPTDGKHVADVVGANPIGFERPRGRRVFGFGYPAGGRYDGERLAYCSGRPAGDPHGVTDAEGLHCDMTQGSSGGPWLSTFDLSTGTGLITSVSSFKYADDDVTMYGPYFGAAIRRLYEQAQKG